MGYYSLLCGLPDHASPFLKSWGWFLISFCIHSSCSPHTSKPVSSRLWIISFPSSASSVPSLHSLSIHFKFLSVAPSLWTHNIRLLSHLPSTIVYLDSFLNKLSFFPSVLNNSWNPILCKSHFELSRVADGLIFMCSDNNEPPMASSSNIHPHYKLTFTSYFHVTLALDLCVITVYAAPVLVTVPNLETHRGKESRLWGQLPDWESEPCLLQLCSFEPII